MNAVDDSVKALFLDLSGVLYEGNNLIPGARTAVVEARNRGLHLRFVTNTATKSSAQVLEQLLNLGIPAHLEELFTAPAAARHLIMGKGWRPYCLIHPAIQPEFSDLD